MGGGAVGSHTTKEWGTRATALLRGCFATLLAQSLTVRLPSGHRKKRGGAWFCQVVSGEPLKLSSQRVSGPESGGESCLAQS